MYFSKYAIISDFFVFLIVPSSWNIESWIGVIDLLVNDSNDTYSLTWDIDNALHNTCSGLRWTFFVDPLTLILTLFYEIFKCCESLIMCIKTPKFLLYFCIKCTDPLYIHTQTSKQYYLSLKMPLRDYSITTIYIVNDIIWLNSHWFQN